MSQNPFLLRSSHKHTISISSLTDRQRRSLTDQHRRSLTGLPWPRTSILVDALSRDFLKFDQVDKFYELYLTEQGQKLNLEKELEDCKGEFEKEKNQTTTCIVVSNDCLIAREIYVGNGDMAVIDVMKFVAEHGSKFDHLIRESKLNGQRMDEAHLQIQGRRGCKSI
ncbi:hypothetical protein P8452_32859 [Trifolium repens]|nr:hypothetical protein P8452_32859 [Trifolium repens]